MVIEDTVTEHKNLDRTQYDVYNIENEGCPEH